MATSWKQPSCGHRLSIGQEQLFSCAGCGNGCAEILLGAVLQRLPRQGCFGMGCSSPSQVTGLVGTGLAWAVHIGGQALKNRNVLRDGFYTPQCWPSRHLCCACTGAFRHYLGQVKKQVGSSFTLEVLSKTNSLTAWPKLNKPGQAFLNFIFICLNDTPVTWTLEKTDPGEELRSSLPLLQFQIAPSSGSEPVAFPAEW